MGLFSQYGDSLAGKVVKIYSSRRFQYYYKVHEVDLNKKIYHAYRIRFDRRYARLVEVREGCPFDLEGEVVCSALRKYLELFMP